MTDRLFQITYALMDEKNITCAELASRFGCSARTIMRDIEKLSLAGVPVFMNRGKGGGIGIMSDYVLDRTVLTDDDKKHILTSLQALKETGFGDEKETLSKLKSLFGKSETDWLEIEFSRWGEPGRIEDYFAKIKKAILGRKIITINYASNGKSPAFRDVRPLKLCFRGYAWYMYAFCCLRNGYRFFKLSRILDMKMTDRTFERECTGRVMTGPVSGQNPKLHVKLKIRKELFSKVADELHLDMQSDGTAFAEFDAEEEYGLVNYILSLGAFAEVLEPQILREHVRVQIESMSHLYGSDFSES